MKAVCWNGITDVRVETVPDPQIINPHDAIVKVTAAAICGSDLHLYDGYIPSMEPGDIIGHEFIGEVVEVGPDVKKLKVGDRVVVPFPISCGQCWFCRHELYSLCDNTNPNAWMAEKMWGYSPAGIFGYSHILGGYAGGQAQYARVPFADVGPAKLSDDVNNDQGVLLSDVFPTGYMAAENCNIHPGDTVAVFGCGPVGQLAIKSAYMLGAGRVIAVDRFPYRLQMARDHSGAEIINYEEVDAIDALREITGGRGPDACIEAVGMEAHDVGPEGVYDRVKQAVRLETGRPHALRTAIVACRKGGTVSLAGVYGGFIDKLPFGAFMNKALTLKTGQTHVQKYLRPLMEHIQQGDVDPSFIVTHHLRLDQAPQAYEIFKHKDEDCVKVVLDPWATDGSVHHANGHHSNGQPTA
jgi:threonine dehydrogenase-like Zn-dependent dehydrogenase